MRAYTLIKIAKEHKESKYEREQRLAKERYHRVTGKMYINPVGGIIEGSKMGHEDVTLFLGPAGLNGARAKDTGVDTLGTTLEQGLKWNVPINAVLGGATGGLLGHVEGGKAGKWGAIGTLSGGVAGGVLGAAGDYIGYKAGKKFAKKQELKEHHHEE